MAWLQLQFASDPETAPRLESLLEEAGAVSVTMVDAADQPVFEPAPGETPLWREVLVTGLFPAGENADALQARLRAAWAPEALPEARISELEDQDWERAWMDDFQPMRFGERLWICPSWCEAPDATAANLLLDPGLAFGTGTHPTTRLCLEWLDSAKLEGQHLVDYGCGSGILGLAALLLGASRVEGVDNDPQALLATRENCQRNGIEAERFPVWLPADFDTQVAERPLADGLLANILAEPLMQLAGTFASLVKPAGWLLLSGILEGQGEAVAECYRPWFTIDAIVCQDGWVRIDARRRPD